jgi:protein-S-isoprenylcysteine O-methyltransferase Ste14
MGGRPSYAIFTAFQILAVGLVLWFVVFRSGLWDLQRYIGTVLVFIGLAGIIAARYQLGSSFSLSPQARKLVTGGVYSKVRNPIYVFGTIEVAGLVLVLRHPELWLLLPPILIIQTLRARREAQVLEAAFGDAYREYRRKTWF